MKLFFVCILLVFLKHFVTKHSFRRHTEGKRKAIRRVGSYLFNVPRYE